MRVDGLVSNWEFKHSAPSGIDGGVRLAKLLRLRPAPGSRCLAPIRPYPAWTVYFMFSPAGQLTAAHRFTLERLKALDRRLLIVCAAPDPSMVPEELHDIADALYWKGLRGYDFSGYAVGLHAIANHSPGADVFVMNDSVYGPFGDIADHLTRSHWDLSGFTASAVKGNHIQSYAYRMLQVTPARMRLLRSVLPSSFSFNEVGAVIAWQETRLARVAARHMTVGSHWFYERGDPTLAFPFRLLELGFPFLKRSLTGKHAQLTTIDEVNGWLAAMGHPTE